MYQKISCAFFLLCLGCRVGYVDFNRLDKSRYVQDLTHLSRQGQLPAYIESLSGACEEMPLNYAATFAAYEAQAIAEAFGGDSNLILMQSNGGGVDALSRLQVLAYRMAPHFLNYPCVGIPDKLEGKKLVAIDLGAFQQDHANLRLTAGQYMMFLETILNEQGKESFYVIHGWSADLGGLGIGAIYEWAKRLNLQVGVIMPEAEVSIAEKDLAGLTKEPILLHNLTATELVVALKSVFDGYERPYPENLPREIVGVVKGRKTQDPAPLALALELSKRISEAQTGAIELDKSRSILAAFLGLTTENLLASLLMKREAEEYVINTEVLEQIGGATKDVNLFLDPTLLSRVLTLYQQKLEDRIDQLSKKTQNCEPEEYGFFIDALYKLASVLSKHSKASSQTESVANLGHLAFLDDGNKKGYLSALESRLLRICAVKDDDLQSTLGSFGKAWRKQAINQEKELLRLISVSYNKGTTLHPLQQSFRTNLLVWFGHLLSDQVRLIDNAHSPDLTIGLAMDSQAQISTYLSVARRYLDMPVSVLRRDAFYNMGKMASLVSHYMVVALENQQNSLAKKVFSGFFKLMADQLKNNPDFFRNRELERASRMSLLGINFVEMMQWDYTEEQLESFLDVLKPYVDLYNANPEAHVLILQITQNIKREMDHIFRVRPQDKKAILNFLNQTGQVIVQKSSRQSGFFTQGYLEPLIIIDLMISFFEQTPGAMGVLDEYSQWLQLMQETTKQQDVYLIHGFTSLKRLYTKLEQNVFEEYLKYSREWIENQSNLNAENGIQAWKYMTAFLDDANGFERDAWRTSIIDFMKNTADLMNDGAGAEAQAEWDQLLKVFIAESAKTSVSFNSKKDMMERIKVVLKYVNQTPALLTPVNCTLSVFSSNPVLTCAFTQTASRCYEIKQDQMPAELGGVCVAN